MLSTAQYRQKETPNLAAAQTDHAANSAGHVLDSSFVAEGSHAPKEQAQRRCQGAVKAAAAQLKTIRILSAAAVAETADASGVKIMRRRPHAAASLLQFAFMSGSHAQDRDRAQDRVTARLGSGGAVRCPLRRCTYVGSRRRGSDVTS